MVRQTTKYYPAGLGRAALTPAGIINSSMYSQPPTTGPLSGIRHQYATSTIEHYPSLPELMHAVYDCSSAMDIQELAFGLGLKPLSLQVAIGRV
jgi:hypothetical protein